MNIRVLIAEDEIMQAKSIEVAVREAGDISCIDIINTVDNSFINRYYDIAIIDLHMPWEGDSYNSAGEFVISRLVEMNPAIFIIIRTSVIDPETISKASNVPKSGNLKFIVKGKNGEKTYLIDEIRRQCSRLCGKNPNRIDYEGLTYICKEDESMKYDPTIGEGVNARTYRYDRILVNGKDITETLPKGQFKAALYMYLVNKRIFLTDIDVLKFSGSSYSLKRDGTKTQLNHYFNDNILKNLKFLDEANLVLQKRYGLSSHRLISKEELK